MPSRLKLTGGPEAGSISHEAASSVIDRFLDPLFFVGVKPVYARDRTQLSVSLSRQRVLHRPYPRAAEQVVTGRRKRSCIVGRRRLDRFAAKTPAAIEVGPERERPSSSRPGIA